MAIFCLSIGVSAQGTATLTSAPTVVQTASKVIDAWHLAAVDADFDQYFSLMTKEGVFVGTDAGEHWENLALEGSHVVWSINSYNTVVLSIFNGQAPTACCLILHCLSG